MYVKFVDNKIVSGPQSEPILNNGFPAENWYPYIAPPEKTNRSQTVAYSLVNGAVVGVLEGSPDYLDEVIPPKRVSITRNSLEVSPILFEGNTYDFNERTLLRFKGTINHWDDLVAHPDLSDLFDQKNGEVAIKWMLADNTVILLTKAELEAVYSEVDRISAIRAAKLHLMSTTKKSLPVVTVRDIQSENWGLDFI